MWIRRFIGGAPSTMWRSYSSTDILSIMNVDRQYVDGIS
jgi:hypothetical protein